MKVIKGKWDFGPHLKIKFLLFGNDMISPGFKKLRWNEKSSVLGRNSFSSFVAYACLL